MAPLISDTSYLGVTPKDNAQVLTSTMGVGLNGTQPTPLAGPSAPGIKPVALAAIYTAGLGGTTTNQSALGQLAYNLSAGLNAPHVAGAMGGELNSPEFIKEASDALSGLGTQASLFSSSKFDDQGMADLANAAFTVGSSELKLPGLEGEGALGNYTLSGDGEEIPKDWIFVIAPQNISWEKDSEHKVVNTYGSNNPYVIHSTTGMRKMKLSDVLVEGFSAGKEVESHLQKLEKMMEMVMNTEKGYVSPYCWSLRAGDKSYGMFIILEIKVKEEMRNAKGRADRARVDITLQQVPEFQINDGRDLATKADLASGTSLQSDAEKKKSSSTSAAKKSKKEKAGKPVKQPAKPLNPGPTQTPLNVDKAPTPINIDRLSQGTRGIAPVRGPSGLTIQPPLF